MKRFIILFILIVFVTVSCAGPSKVRWTKPDFRQEQFEKDREDCIQAVKDKPEQNMSVEDCLTKKGYESEPEPSSNKEEAKTGEIAKNVGAILLVVVFVAVGVAGLLSLLLGGR